jgi:hypothetical protein
LLVFPPIVRAVVAFDLMTRCGRAPEKVRWERTGSWPRYFPSSHLDDDTTRPGEELLMPRLLGCCRLIASCAVTAADGKTISAFGGAGRVFKAYCGFTGATAAEGPSA